MQWPPGLATTRRRRRNVANPTIGSRTQQACKSFSGTNRRGREKRRGRHARHAAAGLHRVATPSASGRWVMKSMKGRGAQAPTNPRRGKSTRVDWGRWTETMETSPRSREERSPGGPDFRERDTERWQRTEGGDRRETSKIPPGDRQGWTRSGKGKRPATWLSSGQQRHPYRMGLHRGP